MKNVFITLFLLLPISFISCVSDSIPDEDECEFDAFDDCIGYSFSLVGKESYENLIGEDKKYHPDSIVITNVTHDTMYHEHLDFPDGWVTLEWFTPYQELNCFNQCKLDSAFIRTYYFYLGEGDTDTLEVSFPERIVHQDLFFNGFSANVPSDIDDSLGSGRSTHWLLK